MPSWIRSSQVQGGLELQEFMSGAKGFVCVDLVLACVQCNPSSMQQAAYGYFTVMEVFLSCHSVACSEGLSSVALR